MSSATRPVNDTQYKLSGANMDARIMLTDTQLSISGKVFSQRLSHLLHGQFDFSGWISFSLSVSHEGGSRLTLLSEGKRELILEGKVSDFDIRGLHNDLYLKKVAISSATTSALHKLANDDPSSTLLDSVSDILAEEVKMVGHAKEIRPKAHFYTPLLRSFQGLRR
jgi:hypothetical protein